MGIEESSNSFSSGKVTADTFSVVAALMRLGGKRQPSVLVQENLPPGSVPGQFTAKPAQTPSDRQTGKKPQMNFKQDQKSLTDEFKGSPPSDWLEPKIFKGGNKKQSPTGENRMGPARTGAQRKPSKGTSTS